MDTAPRYTAMGDWLRPSPIAEVDTVTCQKCGHTSRVRLLGKIVKYAPSPGETPMLMMEWTLPAEVACPKCGGKL